MRLAWILLVVGCGGGRERALCNKGGALCGETDGIAECAEQVKAFKEPLGDKYDALLTCGAEATSCAEFVGCFAGGIGQAVEILGTQFQRGFDKMTDRTGDPKHDAWRTHDSWSTSHHASDDPEPGATTCAKFAGQVLVAKWDDCTDHVRRELACAKDPVGELECLCVEDGVEKWRFTARDPHLDDQAEATRVARSNCHMSFKGF